MTCLSSGSQVLVEPLPSIAPPPPFLDFQRIDTRRASALDCIGAIFSRPSVPPFLITLLYSLFEFLVQWRVIFKPYCFEAKIWERRKAERGEEDVCGGVDYSFYGLYELGGGKVQPY